MADRVPRGRTWLVAGLALPLLSGCYAGLHDGPDDGDPGADGADGAGADGGGADGGGDVPIPSDAQCSWDGVSPNMPLRRLTNDEYDHTIRDLFGIAGKPSSAFVDDSPAAGFAANTVAVSELQTRNYIDVAATLADEIVASQVTLVGCDLDGDAQFPGKLVTEQGRRIFRRDLTADEVADYTALYEESLADGDRDVAVAQVLSAVLASPSFLYLARRPLSDEPELAGYTLASRLSYFLWSTTPSDALLDAAAAGELDTLEGVDEWARQMLEDDRAADTIASFHSQWLGTQGLAVTPPPKDPDAFPGWNDELAAAMDAEVQALAIDVIRDSTGTVSELLTSRRAWVTGPLAQLYGVTAPAGGEGWVDLPEGERAGILTRGAFLSTHAHQLETSIVKRGAIVQTKVLCGELPNPPDNIDLDPEIDRLDSPVCKGCHQLMDPIGYGLESYDAIGGWTDAPAAGEVAVLGGAKFDGGAELSALLADEASVTECVAKQWFQYAHRRALDDTDDCTADLLAKTMADSGGDIREAIVAVATSDSFRFGTDG